MLPKESSRPAVVAALVLIILIALCAALLLLSRPDPIVININPPLPTATPRPTATPSPIVVYVSGEVSQPANQYILPHGSRVSDAIAAAGGMTDSANKARVNMASLLRDGDQVHVASIAGDFELDALPTPSGGRPVYINSASLEELDTLPGIGPAVAQRIIDYREQVSPYESIDDLVKVSGIGAATLERFRDLIALD